jgi:hypothetical protein
MFQLAFHLPYYVWRSSQKPCEDHRQYANGDPLRHSRDVSFLNWKTCGSSGVLYEAQISIVVAGSDEWRWIAYCFVDTYFDADKEVRETVLSYHDDSQADLGMSVDPFTRGQTDLNKPISNPREYFLMVVRFRINQAKCELQQVVEKMYQGFREYELVCSLSFVAFSSIDMSNRPTSVRYPYRESTPLPKKPRTTMKRFGSFCSGS